MELIADRVQLQADGSDICHLVFQVTDEAGQRVAADSSEIRFNVTGPGRILGIGNGNLDDIESNQDLVHRVYEGRGLAVVQSGIEPGLIRIKASSDGLKPADVELTVK